MEIERRDIHLARGFGSLHAFAVEVLGYSDGSAARRVAAMRLMRDMPETGEQLVQGSLTLETMSTLQNHISRNRPSQEARARLVNFAQNLSKRELEKRLVKPEFTTVYLKPELMKKLEELKIVFGLTSLERILDKLADQALAQAKAKEQRRLEREKVDKEGLEKQKLTKERRSRSLAGKEAQRAGKSTPSPAEGEVQTRALPPGAGQHRGPITPPPEFELGSRDCVSGAAASSGRNSATRRTLRSLDAELAVGFAEAPAGPADENSSDGGLVIATFSV
jgi:hypothetical protein